MIELYDKKLNNLTPKNLILLSSITLITTVTLSSQSLHFTSRPITTELPFQINESIFSNDSSWNGNFNDENKNILITNISSDSDVRPIMERFNEKPWEDSWRLPPDITPHLYFIRLEPHLSKGKFDGFVRIFFISSIPRDHVILHSKNLNISSIKLYSNGLIKGNDDSVNNKRAAPNTSKSEESTQIGVKKWFLYDKHDFLIVLANVTLAPDVEYEIHLNYTGSLTMGRLNGFYISRYNVYGEHKLMGTTKFEPNHARLALPCFDEPALKAAVDIEIIKPNKNMTVVSNMPVLKEEPYHKKTTTQSLVKFQGTPPLSLYTLCWIISDFKVVEETKTVSGVLIRALAKDNKGDSLKYATLVTKRSVEFFESYLNVPYSLPKLDIIGVPDFSSGAMENWGMVTFRETNVMINPKTSGYSDYFSVVNVICHEVAHMWFGNLVTMKWWNDIWLNEGFATFLSFKCTQAIQPELLSNELGYVNKKLSALVADTPLNSHPIINNVTTNAQLGGIFDEIAYRKGHSLLEMIETTMGEDNFRIALNSYLLKHEYDVAKTSDFISTLNNFTDELGMNGFVNDWTKQSGYPLITIEKDGEKLVLTQKRFSFRQKDSLLRATKYKWDIPVTYITSDAPNEVRRLFFSKDNYSVVINLKNASDEYKLNINGVGFYRVNYPEQTWQRFGQLLENNSQTLNHWADRANILDDACNLASASHLSYEIPLSLLSYLSQGKETNYAPWRVASKCLSDIKKRLPSQGNTYKMFQTHVRDLLTLPFRGILNSINHNKSSPFDFKPSSEVIFSLACAFKQEDALKKVKSLFHSWIEKSTALNPDIKGVVFKYGISGGEDEIKKWEHVWKRYKEIDDPHELRDLRVALISVKSPSLLKRLIAEAKNESVVRRQDFYAILTSMASKKKTNMLVWDLIKSDYNNLEKKFSGGKLTRLFMNVVSNFYVESQLDEVKLIMNKYPAIISKKEDQKKIEEHILNNMKWRETHQRDIRFWLKKKLVSHVKSSDEIEDSDERSYSKESSSVSDEDSEE